MRSRLEQDLKAQSQEAAHLGPNPTPLPICCVALGKSHNPSVPQFPHLQIRLIVYTRGTITTVIAVVVSPWEGYRGFPTRPGTPPPPRQGLTAREPFPMEPTIVRLGVSPMTPSAQHGSWRAGVGAERRKAGGQCSALS